MKKNSGNCYACNRQFGCKNGTRKSRHHVYPKRFFHGEGHTVPLCEFCHRMLERWIPQTRKLTKEQYEQILEWFCEARRSKLS